MKGNNLIRELKSLFSSDLCYSLLEEKVKGLVAIELPVTLVRSNAAIKGEDIKEGGKVVWDKSEQKTPLRMFLNVLDYSNVELLAVFLHECGHVKDKDDPSVILLSEKSEVSAWKHAINDFKSLEYSEDYKNIFKKVMRESLQSYNVQSKYIKECLDTLA